MGYRQRLQGGPVCDCCAQVHPRGFSSGRWVLLDRSGIELVLFAGYQDGELFRLARVLEGLDRRGGDARGAAARVPSC